MFANYFENCKLIYFMEDNKMGKTGEGKLTSASLLSECNATMYTLHSKIYTNNVMM